MYTFDQLSPSWQTLVLFLCFGALIMANPCRTASDHTVEDAYKALGISPNADGSMNRGNRIPTVNATPQVDDPTQPPIALSKDIHLNPSTKTFIRLFRPVNPPPNTKLPLIIYLHGGDFVLFSVSTIVFHNFCNDIAAQIPAVVASVEYKHAPANRLPAAYEDAMDALLWAKYQALGGDTITVDPWIHEYADFSRVFLLGSASGGNIAYHAALNALDFDLEPINIQGLIMNQPYFGGVQRTESELRLIDDDFVPLYANDVLWTLALPENASRDHEFANPLTGGSYLGRASRLPRCMVKGNNGDPLVDREKQLVKLLESNGVSVVSLFVDGGYHSVELSNTTAAQELYDAVKDFVSSTGATTIQTCDAFVPTNTWPH